jgi:hypothetical protein
MGKGEPRRYRHQKLRVKHLHVTLNIFDLHYKLKKDTRRDYLKAYEQLVSLGSDITAFTPMTYQRNSLLRLL